MISQKTLQLGASNLLSLQRIRSILPGEFFFIFLVIALCKFCRRKLDISKTVSNLR